MTSDVTNARLDMQAREEMARERECEIYTALCISCDYLNEHHLGFDGELDVCSVCGADDVVRLKS